MEQGWDPEVRKYFRKIISTISYGLIWMISSATAGIYYGLAYNGAHAPVYTWLFYAAFIISLFLLLRYYYRTWRSK